MNQSKRQIWKKSMLKDLNYHDIVECLYEISDNGDMYGYDHHESGYYQEYKEQFDELAAGAYDLYCELDNSFTTDSWDDMTVALLGYTEKVLGYDIVEEDYYAMLNCTQENWAVEEAEKRLMRMTKDELVKSFRKVMTTLVLFFNIKSAHDCLTSIVEELDFRGAMLDQKNKSIPDRMWVE